MHVVVGLYGRRNVRKIGCDRVGELLSSKAQRLDTLVVKGVKHKRRKSRPQSLRGSRSHRAPNPLTTRKSAFFVHKKESAPAVSSWCTDGRADNAFSDAFLLVTRFDIA